MTKGQITVEASFIIPLFIIIICSFVYETMLICDRGIINMSVDKYLQETLAESDHQPLTKEMLSGRLFIYEVDNLLVEEKKNSLTVSVKAKPVVSMGIISELFNSFRDYELRRNINTENVCVSYRRTGIVKNES